MEVFQRDPTIQDFTGYKIMYHYMPLKKKNYIGLTKLNFLLFKNILPNITFFASVGNVFYLQILHHHISFRKYFAVK